jgi:hypothetical protein
VSRTPNQNFPLPGQQFFLVSGADEHFVKEDLQGAQAALDDHDHGPNRGKPVGRAAALSVGTAAIQDGAVTGAKIAPGAVGVNQVAVAAVTVNALSPGAVAAALGRDGGLTATSYADGSITGPKLVLGTLTADLFAPGVIPPPTVADGSVTTAKLANGAVTAPKIASGAINPTKLAVAPSCRYAKPFGSGGVTYGGSVITFNANGWAADTNGIGDPAPGMLVTATPSRLKPTVPGIYLVFGSLNVSYAAGNVVGGQVLDQGGQVVAAFNGYGVFGCSLVFSTAWYFDGSTDYIGLSFGVTGVTLNSGDINLVWVSI